MSSSSHFKIMILIAALTSTAFAEPCELPDNGNATIDFPPACPDGYQGVIEVTSGLPPESSIHIDATLTEFYDVFRVPGGDLGGEEQTWSAVLYLDMTGTGELDGFNRNIFMYVEGVTETAPREGDPVQEFDTEMVMLEGSIFGDPDFDLFTIVAGRDHNMPSPGHTAITNLGGGMFNVDSFFDVFYQVTFEGAPGSIFSEMAGSNRGDDRFRVGEGAGTSSEESTPSSGLTLLGNVPNPFNPSTRIHYRVPEGGADLRLEIHDLAGRRVRMLLDGFESEGDKQVAWNGKDDQGEDLPSGVYFYRLSTSDRRQSGKMTLLK